LQARVKNRASTKNPWARNEQRKSDLLKKPPSCITQ
jgi:hypothetical protein